MEDSVEVPQKVKNRNDAMIQQFHSGYSSEENENTNSKRYMHPHAHNSNFLQ